MCQIHNNRVPKGKDIIAYKVFFVKDNQLYTPYQCFQMEVGILYDTGTYETLTNVAISEGFFHSFKNLEDATSFVKTSIKQSKELYCAQRDYRIIKVFIPNSCETDLVYKGEFEAFAFEKDKYIDYFFETYASNQVKLLEEVYVPEIQ